MDETTITIEVLRNDKPVVTISATTDDEEYTDKRMYHIETEASDDEFKDIRTDIIETNSDTKKLLNRIVTTALNQSYVPKSNTGISSLYENTEKPKKRTKYREFEH